MLKLSSVQIARNEKRMVKYGYCVKKDCKVPDRKLADYCLSAGTHETICKNLRLLKENRDGKFLIILKK